MNTFHKAIDLAVRAHHNQRRKYTGEAYITHPLRVGYRALDLGLGEEVAAAAILHDVVEDTHIELHDLVKADFPEETIRIVQLLTKWWDDNDSKESKEIHKAVYYEAILGNINATNVKLLDRIDNIQDMVNMLPTKAKWVRNYLAKTDKEFPPIYAASNNRTIQTTFDVIVIVAKKKLASVLGE